MSLESAENTEPQKAAEVKRTLEERAREWNQSEEGQYAFAEARSRTGHLSSMYPWLPILLAAFAREVLEEAAKIAEGYGTGNFERGGRSTANLIAHRLRQMKEGEPIVVEEADRYRVAAPEPAPEQHVCDSHCAHYCPAPAQPMSAETWSLEQTLINVCQLLDGWHQDGTAWSTWDEEVRRNVSSHIAIQKSAAQQNAALREELERAKAYIESLPANWHEDSSLETWFPLTAEELERAKKDLADSRINHIDANQRNIRAVARAEAAEAERDDLNREIRGLVEQFDDYIGRHAQEVTKRVAAEAKLAKAREELVKVTLELARLKVKPTVDKEAQGEWQ